jgi:PAS domain S-box-containing protein
MKSKFAIVLPGEYPYKILVVDDEEKIRKSLSGLLKDNGYEVVTAGSSQECLQIMSSQYFDLVILDIVMPEMSGIEVLQKIKEKYKDTEAIMISGYADKEKAIATFRLGAYDFIEKPFESSEILNTISHYLNQLELKKEIERKNRELKESEEQYHAIFNEARDGIVLIDRKTGYIFNCNPEFERQIGRRLEELRDMKIWELRSSESREANKKRFFEIKGEGKGYSGEFEFQRPEGKIVPIEFVSKVVEIQGKQFIQSITRDITERKRAEEALRESKGKFNAILQSIGDHMSMMDKDLNIIWANETAKKIFGDDIIGKKCYEAYHGRKEPCEPYPCLTLKAFQDGKVHEHDTQVIGKDGNIIYFHCTANVALRDEEGKPTAVIEISRDITQQKQVEEQTKQLKEYLQLQIERMPIGLIVWDTGFRVQSWNPAAEKIFGFTAEEAFGRHPYDLIVPREAQPHVDNIWRRLLEGDMTAHSINENITKDGRGIICQWSNTPLKKADGTVVGVLSMLQDITKRKQAEDALHKSEEDLKKRVKELEEFYQMAVGRELKMIELKKEIESLKEELSKYKKDE